MIVKELDLKKKVIRVIPESLDDLYRLSFLVEAGDKIYSWTLRSFKIDNGIRSIRGEKIRVYIGLQVKALEFQEFSDRLRIRGIVVEAPEWLHIQGSHHTLVVEPGMELKIIKEQIYSFQLKLLSKTKESGVVLFSVGEDEAAIAEIREQGLRILYTLPADLEDSERSLQKKYEEYLRKVCGEFHAHVSRFPNIIALVIAASPLVYRWLKDFFETQGKIKNVIKGKHVFWIEVSEGGVAGIYELLRSGEIRKLFSKIMAMHHEELLDEIFKALASEERKIAIGVEEVKKATILGAAERILILDSFLRENLSNVEIREIVEHADKTRCEIVIVPFKSEAGLKLKHLGNVVAMLRYPINLSY